MKCKIYELPLALASGYKRDNKLALAKSLKYNNIQHDITILAEAKLAFESYLSSS
jgi:hypothetical protein